MSSDSPAVTASDLQLEALSTPEFINKQYNLVTKPERADALVQLSSSDDSGDQSGIDLLLVWVKASNEKREDVRPKGGNARQIIHNILALLSSVCKTGGSDEAESVAQAQTKLSPEEFSSKLQALTCIRALSQTSQMDAKRLAQKLARRPEFAKWDVKVSSDEEPGCIDVVVKHELSTRTWNFLLKEQQTGAKLDSGTVFAFDEQRAASRIADAVAKQIAASRPHPLSYSSTGRTAPDEVDRLQVPGSWRIKILPEEMVREPSKELRLSLEGGRLVAKRKGGEVAFAIPARDFVDIAIVEREDVPLRSQMAFDAEQVKDLGNGCADQGCAVVAAVDIAMDVSLWTVDIVGSMFGHLKSPKRIVDVAWRENGEIRTAEWQISKGDWKALFTALEDVVTEHNTQATKAADGPTL